MSVSSWVRWRLTGRGSFDPVPLFPALGRPSVVRIGQQTPRGAAIPALVSRTSSLFRDDPRLWELTTVEVADDPSDIAAGVERLLANSDEAITLANRWIERADADAEARWQAFVAR